MRRKLLFTVVIILAFLLATAATALAADEQYAIVRVKLSIGEPTEFSFFADGNYTVGADGIGLERQQYTVRLEGGSLGLYFGAERLASGASIKLVRHLETAERNNFIWMYNVQSASGTNYNFKYLGDMEFIILTNDAGAPYIAAINHVYIEDYLRGVVPSEMENGSHIEALKSQAVASRSYAEYHIRPSQPFDVYDSTKSQVYKGYNDLTNSKTAVESTASTVLTYGGQIIETNFSASNGGYTDIPYHRWGNGADWMYYQFSEDTFDTANTESLYETLTFPSAFLSYDEMTTADNVTGTPDKLKAVACIKQAIFESHQLDTYGVADRNGFELTGVLSLSANTYDASEDGKEDHNRPPALFSNTCVDFVKATGEFSVSIAGAPSITVPNITIDLRYLDGSLESANNEFKAFNADSLTLFVISPVKSGETVTGYSISQKRFGHGCGLSQRGAQQRAKNIEQGGGGQTYDQILGFYYPGTTLTVQGYEAPALTSATLPDHTNASIISDNVGVRNATNTSSNTLLNRLPKDSRIEVVVQNAAVTGNITWHKIYYAGQYAYVAFTQGDSTYISMDASPEREQFTVTYVTNGGSGIANQAVQHAESIPSASIPSPATTKANYTLEGWYFDAGLTSKVTFPYIVTRNTTIYAKWTPTPYAISYDLRGGSAGNPASYTVESGAFTLNNPSRNGYAFSGWTGTGLSGNTASVTIPAGSSGNRAYYANWTPVTYYISYNFNGGNPVSNPGSFTIESPGFTLNNPTRTGYAFAGWTGTGLAGNTASVTIPAGSTGSREYTANWAPYVCDINFDAQGGTPVGAVKRGVWETIAEPSTSRYGYNFQGWFDGAGARVSFPYTVTGSATLYARWAQQPQTNLLAGVGLSSGYLNRAFSPAVTSYKITIGENEGSFTLSPVKQFDGASMTMNKRAVSSYTVNLANGKSAKISVKVTLGKKSKTYTFTVTRPKSSNNYLSSLSASAGEWSQAFDPNVLNYTLTLDENTKSTAIRAAAAAGKAARVSPASKKISLNNGQSKTVKITVKAQSGARRTYTITVARAPSTNAGLKSLRASGLSPGFSPWNTPYTIVLPANKSSVSISARAAGYKAAVYIDGAKKSSKKVVLANGQSATVRVTVAAQAGNSKEYVITVIRQ